MVSIYTDNKLHKSDMFKDRKERDKIVKGLRAEGWEVKSWTFTGEGAKWFGFDAEKDKIKPREIKERLEYLREQIRNESISYGEIAELQSLSKYIDKSDVELLNWV